MWYRSWGQVTPGSCDDEHSQGASSLFPGLSTLPGPLTPFYTNIVTLPAAAILGVATGMRQPAHAKPRWRYVGMT